MPSAGPAPGRGRLGYGTYHR